MTELEPTTASGTSRRRFLAGAAGLGVAAATTTLTGSPAEATTAAGQRRWPRPGEFVSVHAGGFRLRGKPWRYGGTNCYYLHQKSHYMIDSVLNDAAAMSLRSVRAWAFCDGQNGDRPLQPYPYNYDEDAFDSLDYSVYKAGQLGLKLVLALTNNWKDYGGMPQYVQWFLGLPDDEYSDDPVNHDRFYTTRSIRNCYKAWARHVIRRRNPYTGLRYNEDPTIMAWELANEPRNRSDKSGGQVLAWVREMSAYIKFLAPRQLVAVGDEGFYGDPNNDDYPYSDYEGNRWKKFVAVPTVDYGTVHLYPGHWGETPPKADPTAWGTTWINDHLRDGARLRKPVVIEEYGLQIDASKGTPDVAARDAAYTAWTNAVEAGGAGDHFWLLTSRVDDGSFYPDYDGFRIMWRNDDSNPSNSTAHLLADHARTMAGAPATAG